MTDGISLHRFDTFYKFGFDMMTGNKVHNKEVKLNCGNSIIPSTLWYSFLSTTKLY